MWPRSGPFSLCPVDPGSIELVKDVLEQLLPCFSSALVNINCDETFDVGQGRSRAEVARLGAARVYFDFVNRVCEIVRGHGKRALILPCLGRSDKDHQAGGVQGITVEDAMSMVHLSYGMKDPGSPQLRSECAILADMATATLPDSKTPWQDYAEDYDRIRDTMAEVLDGFAGFNTRARRPHGFRIAQPARERVFETPSGRAEFSLAPLPDDVDPGKGRLMLATVRSHDQFNTTIYSNDDRYRGLKGLRTVVFMNEDDMRDRRLEQFDLVDVTSFSKDGTQRIVHGYRAVRYEIPPGCAAGYMPELNVLCGIADVSTQSEQPVTKHLVVEVTPSRQNGAVE